VRKRARTRVRPRDGDRAPADPDLRCEAAAYQLGDRVVRDGVVRELAGDAEGVADAVDLDEEPVVRRVDRHVDAVDRQRQVLGLDREPASRVTRVHSS